MLLHNYSSVLEIAVHYTIEVRYSAQIAQKEGSIFKYAEFILIIHSLLTLFLVTATKYSACMDAGIKPSRHKRILISRSMLHPVTKKTETGGKNKARSISKNVAHDMINSNLQVLIKMI